MQAKNAPLVTVDGSAPDGRIEALSSGFDRALARTQQALPAPPVEKEKSKLNLTIKSFLPLGNVGEEKQGTWFLPAAPPSTSISPNNIVIGPLSGKQVAAILTYNIKAPVDLDILIASTAKTSITFQSKKSATRTCWSHNHEQKSVHFCGWKGSEITGQLFANRLALYQALDCTMIKSMFGHVGKYAFARYGFLPDSDSWSCLKAGMKKNLPYLAEKYALDDSITTCLHDKFENPDPRGLWDIVDIPHRIDGKPLAYLLMGSHATWRGTFDLKNPEQVNRARSYIGPDIFDASMANARRLSPTTPPAPALSTPTGRHYHSPSRGPA